MAAAQDKVLVTGLPAGTPEDSVNTIFSAYGNVTAVKVLPSPALSKGSAFVTFETSEEAQWVVENLNGNIAQGLTDPIQVKFAPAAAAWASEGKGGKDSGKGAKEGASWGKPAAKEGAWGKAAAAKAEPWGKAASEGPYGKGKGKDYNGGKDYDGGDKGGDAGKGKSKGWNNDAGGEECSIKTLLEGVSPALPGKGRAPEEHQIYIRGLPKDTTDVHLYMMFACFGAIQQRGVKAMCKPDGYCTGIGFVDFVEVESAQNASTTLNGTTMPDGAVLTVTQKNSSKGKGGKDNGKGKNKGY